MSILTDEIAYTKALAKAEMQYPPKEKYDVDPKDCDHDFNFIIFCDGGDWDIARCPYCGATQIVRCTFDDDYD